MRKFGFLALALAAPLAPWHAVAEEPQRERFEVNDTYGLGVTEHELDGATEVIGWQISQSWYLGQREERDADDGLSLVWQGTRQQVSFSADGIRFVRRF